MVSDNIANPLDPPEYLQGITNNNKQCWVNIIMLVTLSHGLQLVSGKTIGIGDTKYHI